MFAGVCALVLTVGLARFAYTPMLPIMRTQAGLSYLAGGWLATINYAGYMSGTLLAASISNLRTKFLLYRAGLILAVLSTAMMGMTDNVWIWGALRYLAGFSSAAGILLASGLALNWLIRHGHVPRLGLHFTGLGLGIVISGLAVASMVDWLAWDQLWTGLGLLGVAFFVPAWRWLPAPAAAQSGVSTQAVDAGTLTRNWIWIFTAAYFCAGFGFVISATFIVAILVKLPQLSHLGGWVWVIVGLAAAPSSFLWDRIAQARGEIPALIMAYGLQILSILLPAFSANAALNLFGAALYGGTFVGIVSLTLTLIGRRFPNNPAKAMARLTLSYGVAQMVAPAMAGYIASSTGSYRDALYVTAIVMIIGIALLRMLMTKSPSSIS